MPELPEVETVCRGLERALKGRRLASLVTHRADLRMPLPKNMQARLKGKRVIAIARRAKYIVMSFEGGDGLLLHLGMSGRMVIRDAASAREPVGKHDHIVFEFEGGVQVRFNDPRRFGMCDLVTIADLDQYKLLRHLGIEPLGDALTPAFLAARLKGKKSNIKIALLDQRIVVGVGNIYASEALFHAGISPKRRAGSVRAEELARLVPAIRKVLNAAIKAGGSSLRDYVQADGELGYFQHQFAVYDREGQPCPGCTCKPQKTGGIKRITQGGRSSFYCATKQK